MPDIFGIKLRKNYVCTDSKCMHVTPQAGERPNALMCRIPHPFDQGLAIEDLIRDTLVEDSQMTCDKCENPVVLRSTVDNPPDILFVQITRASYTKTPKGFKAQKITRQVIFDDELIIALGGGQPTRYELYGVVNHQGKIIQRGHYLTVVKGPTGQWAEVNDNQEPKGVNFDTLQSIAIRQNATLLAYRKLAADEVVARVTVATEPRGAKRKKAVDDEGQEEAPPAKSRKPVGEEEKSRWKLLYRVKRLSKWKKDPSPASNREQHRSIRQCIKDIFSSNPSITLVEADEAISEEYYDEEADVLVRPTRKPAKPKGAAKKAKTKAGKKGKK